MELPTLKVERLYRQISNLLIDCIKKGQFLPGEPLPSERDLSKQMGVSRSSIREAFIALEMTGWIEIRVGNGVYVANPLPQERAQEAAPADATRQEEEFSLQALLKARQVFETMLAELAARNATDDQRAELVEVLQDLEKQRDNDENFLREDKRFHLLISEMSGNEVLRDMMEYLWDKRNSTRFVRLEAHYADPDLALHMNVDHARIGQAILDRDPKRASASMREHLQNVYERFFKIE
ncbi:FadR/GntR family transcriptional regulator [Leminorella grimontii]|uniref:FadR/GntR family transcriptional regulator n=1 Tax=Leminorella grimontii TaxID=82981 RepID=UPI00321FCF2F